MTALRCGGNSIRALALLARLTFGRPTSSSPSDSLPFTSPPEGPSVPSAPKYTRWQRKRQ
ncbi:hypothetical protein K505DRAFT_326676 [Melanomma pulvis-pyrius CBS 109.77]|uniref:Uncharacterized protein n=1 Tax=Melanomma pulvis-pyrius CBS 109.77 TaxID=1314802 RepID=A0A6A6X584_9PLEO|nr:hypothetical protein K505DRAFT_326676 [Melanomma pulvis-pyrius CBS 109.77]